MNKASDVVVSSMKGKEGKRGDIYFPCFRCGVCCTKYQVRLGLVEARRIADGLKLDWDEFLYRYLDQRWFGTESFLLQQRNGACVFLEYVENSQITYCCIHTFKPLACSDWSPSPYRPQCQEGLHKY